MKKQHRLIEREHREKERREIEETDGDTTTKQPQMFELRRGEEFKGLRGLKRKSDR